MRREKPIRHVAWRSGRPRFAPGPKLRAAGHKGRDLRHEDGSWFSRGEALDWSDAFCKSLDARKGRRPARAKKIHAAALTVARLWEEWRRSPRWTMPPPEGLRENSRIDYRVKAKIVEEDHPALWNAPAAAVTQPVVRRMFEDIWVTRGLASARGAVLTLSAMFAWAMLSGRVKMAQNPCYRLKMQKPAPRVKFATRPVVDALVAAAEFLGRPEAADMILLALWTGQRQGDRVALVDRGLDPKGRRVFRQQKTGATVAILQAPQLEARLMAAKLRRAGTRAEALLRAGGDARARSEAEKLFSHVVLDETRWLPFSGDHWSRTFAEIRQLAAEGVPAEGRAGDRRPRDVARPAGGPASEASGAAREAWKLPPCPEAAGLWDLDFRDTAVTWMALAGATIPEIISVTGHSIESATEVLKHYLARHPEMADAALRKMIAWYDAGGETEIGL